MFISPLIHLIKPVQMFTWHDLLISRLKDILNIANNWHVNSHVLAYLSGVDIYVNNASLWCKGADHPGSPVIKPHPNSHNDIRIVNRLVGLAHAMHS